jgi:hypothetical protein
MDSFRYDKFTQRERYMQDLAVGHGFAAISSQSFRSATVIFEGGHGILTAAFIQPNAQ